MTRRRLQRMIEINAELAGLRSQITDLVQQSGTSLTGICGVGVFVAARILAEVLDVDQSGPTPARAMISRS